MAEWLLLASYVAVFGTRDLCWLLQARLRPSLIPRDLIDAQADALERQFGP